MPTAACLRYAYSVCSRSVHSGQPGGLRLWCARKARATLGNRAMFVARSRRSLYPIAHLAANCKAAAEMRRPQPSQLHEAWAALSRAYQHLRYAIPPTTGVGGWIEMVEEVKTTAWIDAGACTD
jgi:hypothetical protein